MLDFNDSVSPALVNGSDRLVEVEEGSLRSRATSTQKKADMHEKKQQMPPASVMTRLILIMVWRKLIRNPNTYASLIGLIWSLVSFRCIYNLFPPPPIFSSLLPGKVY